MATSQDSRDEATPTPTATSGQATPGAQLAADADADTDKDVKHEPPSDAERRDAVVEDVADLSTPPREDDVDREVGTTPAESASPSSSPTLELRKEQRPGVTDRPNSPGKDDGVDSTVSGVDATDGASSDVVAKGADGEGDVHVQGVENAERLDSEPVVVVDVPKNNDSVGKLHEIVADASEEMPKENAEVAKVVGDISVKEEILPKVEEILPKEEAILPKEDKAASDTSDSFSKSKIDVPKAENEVPKLEDVLKASADVPVAVGDAKPVVDLATVGKIEPTVNEGGCELSVEVTELDKSVPIVDGDVPEANKDVPKTDEGVRKVEEIACEVRGEVPEDSAIVPEVGGNAADVVGDVPKVSENAPVLNGDAVSVSGDGQLVSADLPNSDETVPKVSEIVPQASDIVPRVSDIVPQVSESVPDIPKAVGDVEKISEVVPILNGDAHDGGLVVRADLPSLDETVPNVSEIVPRVSENVPDIPTVVGDGQIVKESVQVLDENVVKVSEDVLKVSDAVASVSEIVSETDVSKTIEEVPKVLEAPKVTEEVPKVIEDVPKVCTVVPKIEDAPKVIQETLKVVETVPKESEEAPKVCEVILKIEDVPEVIQEEPKVIEEVPKQIEEAPKVCEVVSKIEEDPKVIEKVPTTEEVPKSLEEVSEVCEVSPKTKDASKVIEEAPKANQEPPKVIENVVKAEEVAVKTSKSAAASKKEAGAGGKTQIMEGAPSKARTKRRLPWNDMPLPDEGPDPEAAFYLALAGTIRDNLDLHLDGKLDPAAAATPADAGDAAKAEVSVGAGEHTTAVAAPRSDAGASEEPREPSPTAGPVAKKFTAKRRGERSKRPTIRGLSFLDITTQLIVERKRVAMAERLAPPSTPPLPRPTNALTALSCTDGMGVLGLARTPNPGLPPPETTRPSRPPPPAPLTPRQLPPAPANLSPRKLSLRQRSTESEDGAKDTRPAEVTLLANGERPAFIEDQGTDTEPDPETAVVPAEAGVSVESSNTAARHDAEPRGSAFSGDWVRPRTYVCAACNAPFADIYDLQEHKWGMHPNAWVCHYEFYDAHLSRTPADRSRMSLELYKRFLRRQGVLAAATALRDDRMECTKCERTFAVLPEFHRHILDCGGDTTWMSTMIAASPGGAGARNRSRKWRPFGARRRRGNSGRGRRGMKRNIRGTPGKSPGMRQRSRATDAESIQRMIANLPAKRSTRRAINFQEDIKTRSQATISSNRLLRKRYKVSFVSSFPRPADKPETPAPRRLSAATQLVNAALKFPRRRLPPPPAPAPIAASASETQPKPAKARAKVTAKDVAPPPAKLPGKPGPKPAAKMATKLAAKLSVKSAVKTAEPVSTKAPLKSVAKVAIRAKRAESPKTAAPVVKATKTVSPARAAKKPVILVVKKLPTTVVKLVKRVPAPTKSSVPAKVVTVRTVKVVPVVKATSVVGKAKAVVPKRIVPVTAIAAKSTPVSAPKAAMASTSMAGDILRAMRRAMLEAEPGAVAARNKRKAADTAPTPSEPAAGDSPAIVCSHCSGSYTNRTAYMRHRKSCAGASPLKASPTSDPAPFSPPPRVPCDGCGVLLANLKSRDRHLQRCPVLGPRLFAVRTALSNKQARNSAVKRILSAAKANKAANVAMVAAKASKAANVAAVAAKAGTSKAGKGPVGDVAPAKTVKGVILATKTAKTVAPAPKKTKATKTHEPSKALSPKTSDDDSSCPCCGKRFVYRARLAAHRAICRPAAKATNRKACRAAAAAKATNRKAGDDDVPLARLFRVRPRSSPRLDGRDMPRLEPIGGRREVGAPAAAECPVLSPFSDVADEEEEVATETSKDGKLRGGKAKTQTSAGKEASAVAERMDLVAASPLLAGALDAAKTRLLKAKKKSDMVKDSAAAVDQSPLPPPAEDVSTKMPTVTQVPKAKPSAIVVDDVAPISADAKMLAKARVPRPLKPRPPAPRQDAALTRRSARVARTQTASPGDSASSRDSGVFVDAESDLADGGKAARSKASAVAVTKGDASEQSGLAGKPRELASVGEFAVKVRECNDGALKPGKEVATSDGLVGSKGTKRLGGLVRSAESEKAVAGGSQEAKDEEVTIVAEVKRCDVGKASVCREKLEVSDDEAIEVDHNETEETSSEASGFVAGREKDKAIELVQRKIEELFASTMCNEKSTKDLKQRKQEVLACQETKVVAEAVQSKFVEIVEEKRRAIKVVAVDSEPEECLLRPKVQALSIVKPEERRRSGSATQARVAPPSVAKRRVSWEGEAVGKRLRMALEYGIRQIDDDVLAVVRPPVAAVDCLVRAVANSRRSSATFPIGDEPMADIDILAADAKRLAPDVSSDTAVIAQSVVVDDKSLPTAALLVGKASTEVVCSPRAFLPALAEEVLSEDTKIPIDVLPLATEVPESLAEPVVTAGPTTSEEDEPQSSNTALKSEGDQPSVNATSEAGSVHEDNVVSPTNEAISAAVEDLSVSTESDLSTNKVIVREDESKSEDDVPIEEKVDVAKVSSEPEAIFHESSTTVIEPSAMQSPKLNKKSVIIKLVKKPKTSTKKQKRKEHAESSKKPSTLVNKPLPLALELSKNEPLTGKTSEEPFSKEPVLEEPVAKEPVAKEPVSEEPVAKEPVAKEPVSEEPVSKEPVAKEPAAKEPVSKEPAAKEPVAKEPVSEEPVAKEPVSEEPAAKEPVSEEPVAKEPVSEEPVAKEPVSKEPAAKEPVSEEPAAKEPVSEEPVAKEPVAKEPVSKEPVPKEPVAKEPVSKEPVSKEPVAKEPVAKEPVSKEPVAKEPVSKEPVSKEPVAKEPVSKEPVSEEPVAKEPVAKELVSEEPASKEPEQLRTEHSLKETLPVEEGPAPTTEEPALAPTPTTKEPSIKEPSTKEPVSETSETAPNQPAPTANEPALVPEPSAKEPALVPEPSAKEPDPKAPSPPPSSATAAPASACPPPAKRKARRGKGTREPKRPPPAKKAPTPAQPREARRTRCPLSYEEMVDVSSEDSPDEDDVVVARPPPKDAASPARGRAATPKGQESPAKGVVSFKAKESPGKGRPPTPKDKDFAPKAAVPMPKVKESPVKAIIPAPKLKDSPAKGVILVPIKGLVLPTRDRQGTIPRPNNNDSSTKWLILAPIDKKTSTSEVMTITRDKDAPAQPAMSTPRDLSIKKPLLELALTKGAAETTPPPAKKTPGDPMVDTTPVKRPHLEVKSPPSGGRRFGAGGGDGQCLTSHLSCATCNKHYYSKSTFATHLRSVTHVVRAQLAAQADEARKAAAVAADSDEDVRVVHDSRKEAQVLPVPREEVRVVPGPREAVQTPRVPKEVEDAQLERLYDLSSPTTRGDDDSALGDAELAETRRREEERRAASLQSVAQWLAQQDPAAAEATARGKAASVRGVDGAPPAKRRRVKVTARRSSLPLMASSSSCSWSDALSPTPSTGDRLHPLACDSSPSSRANPSEWAPANRPAGKAPCYSGFSSNVACRPRGRRVKATPRRRPSKEASRAKSRILQSVYLKQATLLVPAETAPVHHKPVATKPKPEAARPDKPDAAKAETEVSASDKATDHRPEVVDVETSEPVVEGRPQDRLAVFDFDEDESRDSTPGFRPACRPKPPLADPFDALVAKPTAAVRPMNCAAPPQEERPRARVGRPPKQRPRDVEDVEEPGPCKNAISQAVVDVSNILVLEPSRRRAPVCYTELWDDLESESSDESGDDEPTRADSVEPESRPREEAEPEAKEVATESSVGSWADEDFRPSKPMFRDLWEESETEDGDEAANKSSVLCCVFGKARRPEQAS